MSDKIDTIIKTKGIISDKIDTKIIIKAKGIVVGAIQQISFEKNSVKPNNIECNLIRFNNDNLSSVFLNGVINTSSQLVPFNILVLDDNISNKSFNIIVFENVWIRKIGVIYTASNLIVLENVVFESEYIYWF
jgi:hypothetical protein